MDGNEVYVLDAPFHLRIDRIDYFHGMVGNSPMAQLLSEEEPNVLARDMVPLEWWGNTVKRITVLQRKWRKWINQRWQLCVQLDIIQLAKEMLKVIKDGRKLGWIVPSLDYERKLAERDYSWASKRQRLPETHHLQRLYWETRIQLEQVLQCLKLEADMSAATEGFRDEE